MTDTAGRQVPPGSSTRQRAVPFTRRATVDADEAETIIADLYLPNRLELPAGPDPLDMDVTGLQLGGLTASRLTYGRHVHLRTSEAENFHVNLPLQGRAISRNGAGDPVPTGPGEALVFSPGAPAEISWSARCEQLCLMVARSRLEAELETLLDSSLGKRLVFDFQADLGTPFGRRWAMVLELLVAELDHPTELGSHPRLGPHLEAMVLDGLLLSQRHSHSDLVLGTTTPTLAPTVRRAVGLIEERPSEPWTTVRLATEVHLSVRALQEGFRRDLDSTPMEYLRSTRLRRAREQLLSADRDATTVSVVATGLGILHLGRFAAAYRRAYGESPSQTLARSG